MIQANELRIGNYVIPTNARHNESFIKVESISLDSINIDFREYNLNELNPIPLTPEILEKCGAMLYLYQEDEHKRLQIGTFTFSETKTGIILFDDTLIQAMDVVEVQYLHQLQNLYFALTGEELNVNI